jgi:hypothetical protein
MMISHQVGRCVMTPFAHNMSHAASLGVCMHDQPTLVRSNNVLQTYLSVYCSMYHSTTTEYCGCEAELTNTGEASVDLWETSSPS